MIGDSNNRVDSPLQYDGEAAHLASPQQGLFSTLTQLETLHAAYAQLSEASAMDVSLDGSRPPLAGDEVTVFLEQLSEDLRAGTFRMEGKTPSPSADSVSDNDARTQLRNRIVQFAVSHALERVFTADAPANSIAWTTAIFSQGLSRVYAIAIEENDANRSEHILAVVRRHLADTSFLELLADVLKCIDFRTTAGPNPLASVLRRVAMHNVDQVLLHAKLLGRQGSNIHATCMRFDYEVALFLDGAAQYDWLLPAVQKRLRDALAEIKAEADPEQTQLIDLTKGEKLRFLDHEFRLTKDRNGTACVEYKPLVKPPEPKPEAQKPSRRNWKLRLPAWPRRVRPKLAAREEAPSGRQFHWPSLNLHWPRWSWNWSLKVPRRVYAVARGVIIVAGTLAMTAIMVALFGGHGPQLYPVRGQVFYEGQPAVGALVVFLPQDPTSPQTHVASAIVADDGSYSLGTNKAMDGAMAGPYVVTIWKQRNTTARLPARYASRRTTPLTAIVKMGPTDVPVYVLQAQSP